MGVVGCVGFYVTRGLGGFCNFAVVEEMKPQSARDKKCVHGFGDESSRTVV